MILKYKKVKLVDDVPYPYCWYNSYLQR